MLVFRDDCEAVNVAELAKFAQDVKKTRLSNDWLRCCMLPCPQHTLPFVDESNVQRNATKYVRRHWTEPEPLFFLGWYNGEHSLVVPEEKGRLYVATALSWKKSETCRVLTVLTVPLFAYKANVIFDVVVNGTISIERDVCLRVASADHVVTAVTQFLECA